MKNKPAQISQLPIESGVPRPPRRSRIGESIYPFSSMKVGDSFYVKPTVAKRQSVQAMASRYKFLHPGWDYQTNVDGDGTRVWRIA